MMHDSTLPRFAIGRASEMLGAASPLATDVDTLRRILERRQQQVVEFGHTPEKDRRLPPNHLPGEAGKYVAAAIEDLQFAKPTAQAIMRLEKAGALILAAIARLQLEEERGQ